MICQFLIGWQITEQNGFQIQWEERFRGKASLKGNEITKFTNFPSIIILLRHFTISGTSISCFRAPNVSSILPLSMYPWFCTNYTSWVSNWWSIQLLWSTLPQSFNLLLHIWIGNSEETQIGNGFRRRVLMSFKEKPKGSNLTFNCAPSGPCVPCIYSEKVPLLFFPSNWCLILYWMSIFFSEWQFVLKRGWFDTKNA